MIRRLTSFLLLSTFVLVQLLPGTAGAMACRMDRSAQDKACMRCDAGPAGDAVPTLAAGTCCRFAAAPDIPRPSGVLVASQRLAPQDGASALAGSSIAFDSAMRDVRVDSPDGSARSTSPPPSSTVSLRL